MIFETKQLLRHRLYLMLTAIDMAFSGKLSTDIVDPSILWGKCIAANPALANLVYKIQPSLLLELGTFVVTDVRHNQLNGLFIFPYIPTDQYYVHYTTTNVGHFSLDNHWYLKPQIPPSILLRVGRAGSEHKVYYMDTKLCPHQYPQPIVQICQGSAILDQPPDPNYCSLPLTSCYVKPERIASNSSSFYRHYLLGTGNSHIVATNMKWYEKVSSGSKRSVHRIKNGIDYYFPGPGQTFIFGQHSFAGRPTLQVPGVDYRKLAKTIQQYLNVTTAEDEKLILEFNYTSGTLTRDIEKVKDVAKLGLQNAIHDEGGEKEG